MTGSGKTLAFALPLIANTNNYSKHLQHIVVVPTRELSVQINNVLQALSKGGSKKRKQNPVRILRTAGVSNDAALDTIVREEPHILIGTPQIVSHVLCENKDVNTSHLTHVVFDEVDQLISQPKDREACMKIIQLQANPKLNMAMRALRDHETVAGLFPVVIYFASLHVGFACANFNFFLQIHSAGNWYLYLLRSRRMWCS